MCPEGTSPLCGHQRCLQKPSWLACRPCAPNLHTCTVRYCAKQHEVNSNTGKTVSPGHMGNSRRVQLLPVWHGCACCRWEELSLM